MQLENLAVQAAAGDMDAAERLIIGFHDNLMMSIALNGIPVQDRDSIAQDAAIKVLKSLPRYQADQPFLPWLRGIARHLCADYWRTHYREKKRRDQFQRFMAKQWRAHDTDDYENNTDVERLRTCMQELSESQRHLIDLTYVDGHNSDTVAEQTGRTAAAIRKNLQRLREKLADCIRTHKVST